jgi:hypothetical protein
VLLIPNEVFIRYFAHLNMRGIIAAHQGQYKKWLRYYLDFCDKYPVPVANSDRVRLFCEKLQEKKQSEEQREHAAHAISLYFEMNRQDKETQPQGYISRDESLGKEAESLIND